MKVGLSLGLEVSIVAERGGYCCGRVRQAAHRLLLTHGILSAAKRGRQEAQRGQGCRVASVREHLVAGSGLGRPYGTSRVAATGATRAHMHCVRRRRRLLLSTGAN